MVSYCEALQKQIQALVPQSSSDIGINYSPNGFSAHLKRRGAGSSVIVPTQFCPFGVIVKVPDTSPTQKQIQGGVVHCGETNYTVGNYDIDLESAVDTLLWHKVDFNAATDDDNQVFLPGIENATGISTWQTGSSYPDASLPSSPDSPAASVIVPIGHLIVTIPDGAERGIAVFYPAACGNITITHCIGTVGYTRGGA